MHFSKFAALAMSLSVAPALAQNDSNCTSVSTVFVTVTANPVTTTISIPFEVSPSVTGKDGVPSKVQLAVDTAKNITVTSTNDITVTLTEDITLVRVVTSVVTASTPAAAAVQPSPPSSHVSSGGSPDLTGHSTVFLTVITEVFETETVTETAPAVDNFAAVMVSSLAPVSSSDKTPLASPVLSTNAVPSAVTTSLVTITRSKPFTGLDLSGWNATFTALLKENLVKTGDQPTKALGLQTGVGDNLAIRTGTAVTPLASSVSFNATVPSATASAVAIPSSKTFARLGLNGLNATLTTLLKEKLLKTANEPAKPLSQQTGVKENLATRSWTSSLPAALSSFLHEPSYYLGVRQLGSSSVSTIEGDAASLTSNYDGAALTTPAPVVIPSDAVSNHDQTVTSKRHGHRSDKSCESSNTFSSDISSQQSLAPTDFQSTLVLSPSSAQQPAPAANTTSPIPTISVLPAFSTAASTIDLSNGSSVSRSAVTAENSCNGAANFTINFDDLPQTPTSAESPVTPTIVNPYRKLFFEGHYRYVHLPNDPFPPVSPSQLAQYRVDQTVKAGGPADSNRELVGEFGAGPRASDSAYWIDAFSLWLGCQNAGPSNCVITINGYDSTHSTSVVSTTVTQPPCPGLSDCTLALVQLPRNFRNLAGVQILATVDRTLTTFYVDDVSLGWSNNTCAAQAKRASAP